MPKKVQIYFDEEKHKYTDNEGNAYTSVTQLLSRITPKYDSEFWCMYRALDQMNYKLIPDTLNRMISVNGKWHTLIELYAGIYRTYKTPKQITDDWKSITQRSLDRGNETHNYLEDCINAMYGETTKNSSNNKFDFSNSNNTWRIKIKNIEELDNSPLKQSHPTIYSRLKKFIEKGYVLYAEKRVYSYEHKVSGTIDVLAVKGKDFWIIDWKTNKDELKFESGYYKKKWNSTRTEKVKTTQWVKTNDTYMQPLHRVERSKGKNYVLQLSIYAYICELWGLCCRGLLLFHIRRTDEKDYKPKLYQLDYLKKDVSLLMDWQLEKQRVKNYYNSKQSNKQNHAKETESNS